MTIGRFWSIGFSDWSSDLVCKEGWETVTSFLEAGLDSWICISLGNAAFFLECTLSVIQFSRVGSIDDNSSLEKEGTNTRSNPRQETLGGSMRKGSMK